MFGAHKHNRRSGQQGRSLREQETLIETPGPPEEPEEFEEVESAIFGVFEKEGSSQRAGDDEPLGG